jgi:hypothetical protein
MDAVGKSIGFEEGTPNFAETQLDETVRQKLQFLLSGTGLRFGLKRPREQLDEGSETELVHIVDLDKVSKHHVQVRPDVSEVPVDFSLLVK